PNSQKLIAIKNYITTYEQARTIWMDGRPHPPDYAAHTWEGFSTGRWEGDVLTVETSHIKQGWIRRNGLPESDRATLVARFFRPGEYLTHVTVLTDPVYLTEPLVKSQNFVLNQRQLPEAAWLWPCEIVEEIAGRPAGGVPRCRPARMHVVAAEPEALEAQAVRATILGVVQDISGAVMPGVTIEVRNLETGIAQSVITNTQGRYNAPDLAIGTYEVQASLQGFRSVVHKGVTLRVGSQNVIDFTLPLGPIEETVTVTRESPIVETTSSAVATTIEQKQIADLPLNGRNYAQLITLAPAVTTVTFAGSLFGRQTVYSVAGGRPEGQAFLLDNTNVANFWNRAAGSGVLGTTLGVDAIAEFQTLTNTYRASLGGGGGVIN